MRMFSRAFAVAAGFALVAGAAQAWAEAPRYPSRPVRFIVPFPPAGGTDIVARLLAERLGEGLSTTFVVDSRPGAASTVGSAIAARAVPDGYTLLMVTASFAIAAGFYANLPYDPVKDFEAVARVAAQPLVLVATRSLPVNSVAELVKLAKASPGKLNYASGGEGGINHLAMEMFDSAAGTRIAHVPYKGAGPALASLIGGETQIMIATLGSAIDHIRSGRLKALAVGSASRSPLLPDAPTLAEAGLRGYEASNWYGILAPRATPASVIGVLERQVGVVLRRPDVAQRLEALAFDPAFAAREAFSRYLREEVGKWTGVIRSAGVK